MLRTFDSFGRDEEGGGEYETAEGGWRNILFACPTSIIAAQTFSLTLHQKLFSRVLVCGRHRGDVHRSILGKSMSMSMLCRQCSTSTCNTQLDCRCAHDVAVMTFAQGTTARLWHLLYRNIGAGAVSVLGLRMRSMHGIKTSSPEKGKLERIENNTKNYWK